MALIDLANLSNLDEAIFNTWESLWGRPAMVLDSHGRFAAARAPVACGPGAFVADAHLERGYNAWFGAPGYYVDAHGVDRVINDQYIADMYPPQIGVNPWDHIFGTFSGDPVHFMARVRARMRPIQAGVYSNS
jgi:hypothetical protein